MPASATPITNPPAEPPGQEPAREQPQPRPTVITWCEGCGRIGRRKASDVLDESCRYCGDTVRRRRLESKTAAIREMGRLRNGPLRGVRKAMLKAAAEKAAGR